MAADISIRLATGQATVTAPIVGIDLISANNTQCSMSNRIAYPVLSGTRSYEKWLVAQIDGVPTTAVSNFRFWRWNTGESLAITANTTLYWGVATTYATPVSSASTVATTALADGENVWDAGSYSTLNDKTKFLVFQLSVGASAVPGYWNQQVIFFKYTES